MHRRSNLEQVRLPVEILVHRLGEGRFEGVFIADSISTAERPKGGFVNEVHGFPREEDGFVHRASFSRNDPVDLEKLGVTFPDLRRVAYLTPDSTGAGFLAA
jgi:hypothetical protein